MSDTPDEPRPPGEDAGDQQDRWPYRPANPPTPPPTPPEVGGQAGEPGQPELPEQPPTALGAQPPFDSPTQQALSDLPPIEDDPAESAGRRRWLSRGRLAVVGLALVALLGGGVAFARSGGDGGDGSGGVASVDGSDGDQAQADDSSGGNSGPADQSEMQDAMLDYAECMRDHGIDMPDPEFDGNGPGMVIQGGGPESADAAGPGGEEFEAADEECNDILEDVRGDMPQMSPEDQAELQDKLVAMAECMRDKGYDMPDPEVNGDGGVQIQIGSGPRSGADETGDPRNEQFQEDQQDCNEQAGLNENGVLGGGGPGSDTSGSDDGSST